MAYAAKVLRVMVASPSDVQQERLAAQTIIHGWNVVHSASRGQVLLPVLWETHTSPALGGRAQSLINRQIVSDSDMLIAMFWTRIGTPTGESASGTIEEIEEHVREGKPVMLYFSNQPVRPDSIDERQYAALLNFKKSAMDRGLVEEYESIEQFRDKLTRQLAQTIIQNFSAEPLEPLGPRPILQVPPAHAPVTASTPSARTPPDVSSEAVELLLAASKDRNGVVLLTETMGGLSLETNERQFAERGNARSEAKARRLVRELLDLGIIEQRDRDGEVFAVTDEGYRVADQLENSPERARKREVLALLHALGLTAASLPREQSRAEQIRKVTLWPTTDPTLLRSLASSFGATAAALGAEAHRHLTKLHRLAASVQDTSPARGFDWRKFDWRDWLETLEALERTLAALNTEIDPRACAGR